MKLERKKVKFPLWRKKVDSSLFHYNMTPIPNWACDMWAVDSHFQHCSSKKNPKSRVTIVLEKEKYDGWVTCSTRGEEVREYRLWYSKDLQHKLKDVFVMTFMRDIEYRLRKDKSINIEDEIPFWEFLDIEYDSQSRVFYFSAYYTQKPSFPELFKRMIGSPMLHKIDDELSDKRPFRIYTQGWKPREQLDFEIEAENVLYYLIDTVGKLLYIGEASRLVKRLRQEHSAIKNWNYYRYDVLPTVVTADQRVMFERMLIRDLASLLGNKATRNRLAGKIGLSHSRIFGE